MDRISQIDPFVFPFSTMFPYILSSSAVTNWSNRVNVNCTEQSSKFFVQQS